MRHRIVEILMEKMSDLTLKIAISMLTLLKMARRRDKGERARRIPVQGGDCSRCTQPLDSS